MALIALAVHDTEENRRSQYTEKCFESLIKTVDFTKHRLFIVDNNSCKETKEIIEKLIDCWALNKLPYTHLDIKHLTENIGTARAINIAWRSRRPGENAIKMDNDIVTNYKGWVDEMEEAIRREPRIGQIGLKRKDCWETTWHENKEHRAVLHMLPHEPGERWILVEQVKHVMGSCVMHSSALLDKVGYMYQPNLYGYDDVLMSWRTNLSGFMCVFLSHVPIDHIDPGGTEYQGWKERHSGEQSKLVSDIVDSYINKSQSLFYDFY